MHEKFDFNQVIRATVPEMTRRLLRPMVLNSVDNMLNVILGDRTIPELFPKMAKQRIGCMKPCRCPNNRGPNGLPLPRASACGLDNRMRKQKKTFIPVHFLQSFSLLNVFSWKWEKMFRGGRLFRI